MGVKLSELEELSRRLVNEGRVEIRYLVWKNVLLGAVGAALSGGCLILVIEPDNLKESVVGWLGIALFVSGTVIALWRIVDRRPKTIVTQRGIAASIRGFPKEDLSWSAIREAKLGEQPHLKYVELFVDQPDRTANPLVIRLPMPLAVSAPALAQWLAEECFARRPPNT